MCDYVARPYTCAFHHTKVLFKGRNAMIVYKELATVERTLGVSAKTLYGISNNIGAHYRKVSIPKKNGSVRVLSVPDEVLKKIQRLIVENLLAYEPVSPYAKAYKPASGIKNNAGFHVGKAKILKLDILDFFDNIMYFTVKEKVFPSNKYSESIRVLLSMLCYYNDVLPQGAPTSPIITNIIMRDFDETVGTWCRERKISYTRYCDDMTFSGDFDERAVIGFVSEELRKIGLFLNKKKTVVARSGQNQTVTGIVVNQKLSVPSEYKRKIRQEVFYCQKFGVRGHMEKSGVTISPEKYLISLLGKINYVLHICPNDETFKGYKKSVLCLLEGSK